ncbi:MAG: bifunctional pyr operon transcriptional regulator/uracil phosphoribosyltransferase PyrR [Endomicrobium sp.]|jgi:pyrimidine operon attenuation protein/uracil phosphoribosyltransferase|nr:bifunctional pyr operon transcriptional regulator/uracil phosphoribosyltransferase PyrR [Endomicrobium sp.]
MTKIILNDKQFQDNVNKIAEKIFEDNKNIDDLAIVGIQNKGVFLAKRIISGIAKLANIKESQIPFGTLDITLYRDDLDNFGSQMHIIKDTEIPFDINRKNVVLIDDVLYTGRTVRAALDVLMDFGRPKSIRLAVLIDRGFRELPIEPNYLGIKYKSQKFIKVTCKESDEVDEVTVEL